MNTAIQTTYPYEATSPGVARHQCTECGGWEREDKGLIRHSKRCESRAQGVAAAQTSKPAAREPSASEVRDSHERDVQDQADRGVQIQPRDWSRAMNRDD